MWGRQNFLSGHAKTIGKLCGIKYHKVQLGQSDHFDRGFAPWHYGATNIAQVHCAAPRTCLHAPKNTHTQAPRTRLAQVCSIYHRSTVGDEWHDISTHHWPFSRANTPRTHAWYGERTCATHCSKQELCHPIAPILRVCDQCVQL